MTGIRCLNFNGNNTTFTSRILNNKHARPRRTMVSTESSTGSCLCRLAQPVERLQWRDRRDSNPKSNDAQSQSEKGIPPFTKEQWTQMWTHFSGEDRRMLSQIVERWGSLSDELKRAVLRVAG